MEPQQKRIKMATQVGYSTSVSLTEIGDREMPLEASPLRVHPMTRKNETITLLPAESLLRSLLLDSREHMAQSKIATASNLDIWFTGGWVRDRLLDIPCSDIDIAVSTMTGQAFGDALADFFQQNEQRYQQRARELGVQNATMSGLHTTKQNLRKSKQLETTIGHIFGLDVDIVNLRKEVYDQDSRTPVMEFGTAEQDAFRRDATVNSLFFNLDSQKVVDLTGKGLHDMAAGIIRTPLEARQTFMDDPLRVLRLIRIGSKLGYTIDDKTSKCMRDQDIHQALTAKVSRERVGIELFKIMKQPNPQLAFHLIYQEPHQQWPATWPRAYHLLAALLNDSCSRLGKLVKSDDIAESLWVMAAYAPIAGLRHDMLQHAVETAAEAIKATAKTSKLLDQALRNIDSIRAMVTRISNQLEPPPARSTVGMAIRAWGAAWKSFSSMDDAASTKLLQQYNGFLDFVVQRGLEDAYGVRPLLDGNVIMELFGVSKGGGFVKTAMDELVAWQFDNEGLGVDEAKEWLRQQEPKLGIPPRVVSF
ncbi:poly A polymerase head domain-containing protein [Hirsutella rhossiliensis]|uniref:Poly A polymerase head domain-containing protein n=1 Tax=Hirsutella rhossiliensis TaxID=111463 RepID=A0A9P8N7Q8_9HYPO|nr:poly A polymerase head domain-containing protein [Hirsutella rhossiliensis]KAH0966162.1 poly A polymerase head domain-containing protein [Hirsutella rhossiliensis]